MKPRQLSLLSTGLVLVLTGCASRPEDSNREALLALPYKQFDQTPGAGWRTLDKRNREAATLIEEYLKRHGELTSGQSGMLHFHAAQLLASEGENRKAIAHLKRARSDGMTPGYNEFADAMRAFLERDRNEVLAIRDRVAQYPSKGMTAAYQSVVNSFADRFDSSYNEVMAYEAAKQKK